uniref:Uncharacterized protein n=1 Tax=Candidatus Kentrum sp. FW TaxID=2126338 RepID=A0A450TSN2_9GAMM|nr:MAG: hypothetical protein BECKFW1821C_GA0114237_102733 [Candidatus Kentron sp. FW]
MLTESQRTAIVQHTMNITGLMQQIEEELQTILEVAEIEVQFVPFTGDFPDLSLEDTEEGNPGKRL